MSQPLASSPIRSLIIAPQWIGDAVMTEPLMAVLHSQGERLTVGAVPWVAPIYRAMPEVNRVIELPFQHGGLQWQARCQTANDMKGQFDRAYVLPNSLKSALLPLMAKVPERIGYLGEMRFGLLTKRLPNPPRHARGSMVAHYLALANVGHAGRTRPQLFAAPTQYAGLSPKTYMVIVPGAEYGPAKRWPIHHFAELIAKLGFPVVLLGSAKENALCESIREQALQITNGKIIHNLAGKTSLVDAIQIIAHAQSMVSNDSGLMHVAAAFGIPQVAIFGSSSPLHTPPLNEHAKVLWLKEIEGLDCSPCFKRECPLTGEANLKCLNNIQPARVIDALATLTLR